MASQTATERGEAELHIYNLKKTSPPQSQSQKVVCVSTARMYPQSGYFLVCINFEHQMINKREKVDLFFLSIEMSQ